jgi:5'-methylthioadenosine phosphorylase
VQALRPPSPAHQALRDALMTPAAQVPPATRRRTELFTAPYWGPFTGAEGGTTAAG